MLRNLFFIFVTLLATTVEAQKHWEIINLSNGLDNHNISLFEEESNGKWWVVTDSGISLINNGVVANYPNANLNASTINDIQFAQGKLWIASLTGLYSFDGSNLQNFGLSSGFKTLLIRDIDAESNGNLWIATDSAVSMYNGQSFVRHDSISGKFLLIDGNDRVHVYFVNSFLDVNGYNFIYVNNQWEDLGSFFSSLYIGNGLIEDGGKIYLTAATQSSNSQNGFYEFDYPNQPNFQRLDYDVGYNLTLVRNFIKDGAQYFAADNFSLFFGRDSTMQLTHYPVTNRPTINTIDQTGNQLVLCTDKGLIYSNKLERRSVKTDSLDLNAVKSKLYEYGPPFSSTLNGRANGFGLPKGNPTYSIYTADLLFVGRDSASQGFRNTLVPYNIEWNSGPVSDVYGTTKSYMVKIQKQDVINHRINYNQVGYQMPASIKNWPAVADSTLGIPQDLAPFVDVNQNGCYDPQNGDYPMMKGDEAIYWIRHHPDSSLLLEYHYMLYAYNNAQIPELDQVQFLQCRIVNRSGINFDSAKVGFFFDGDLGMPSDDYVGCDSINNIGYFYNGDNFDEAFQGQPGFGQNSPAVGVKFLSDSMTNLVYYNIGGGQNGDPRLPIHWWNYMNSRWQNGQPLLYGGNGLNTPGVSNRPTTHMLTGDPFTNMGWTESDPGSGQSANPPGDRRLLAAIDNFKFSPGESKIIELVVGYGRKSSVINHVENVPELIRVLNRVEDFWDTLSTPTFINGSNYDCSAVGLADLTFEDDQLKLYPNPAKDQLFIESEVNLRSIQFYSMNGGLVKEMQLNHNRLTVDLSDFKNGLYLIRAFDESGNWTSHKLIVE